MTPSDGGKSIQPRIVVLISGSGTNLQALIDSATAADYPGRIVGVGSNRPDAGGLERAQRAGIETFVIDHTQYDNRESFDAALIRKLEKLTPDLVVLAGFMRILTDDLVRYFRGRLINIHPSILPNYQGLKTHARALEAGDTVHGTSVHFVTEELDGGPIIAQAEVPVLENDTDQTLGARVQAREHVLYPIIVRWFCEGRINLGPDDEVLFDGEPIPAILTLPADVYQ
ncbi:phosphoribosylglycinamide formyltransferase [Marinobacter fonticola]|uniref:phosphoribosylglycinamide formyltransferase n=1 Tax=Marinobacter fonticola TaxID=2603215 RepID=UPI0011E7138D|nr:phosphoribosylglycinamide formyltransferase [Marinobacter fonticola]